MTFAASGFSTLPREFALSVNQDLRVDAPLEVAGITDPYDLGFIASRPDELKQRLGLARRGHREPGGRGVAARRAQLLRVESARPRRGAARARLRGVGARRLRLLRQRRARGREQLPARRRLQRGPEAQHLRRPPARGRRPRVRDADLDLRRLVRPQRGRAGQRRAEVGDERVPRLALRVPPQRPSGRAQLLRARGRGGAEVHPQPVRLLRRRAGEEEQHLLLRRLRGDALARRHHARDERPDARRARGRLLALVRLLRPARLRPRPAARRPYDVPAAPLQRAEPVGLLPRQRRAA